MVQLLPQANPYEDPRFVAAFPEGLRPGGLALTQAALEYCAFQPGSYMVDLGCGTGVTLQYLAQNGYRVLGLDISAQLLNLAQAHGPVQKASMDSLPLADGTVDGLFCECVLSLAENKARVLGEIKRVLKLGGFLILSDLFPKPGPSTKIPLRPRTCAAGAISYKRLTDLLAQAGLIVKYQRDHEKTLKSLAARLVWEYGSLENLAKLWPGDLVGCLGRNLTYGLIIAQSVGAGRINC